MGNFYDEWQDDVTDFLASEMNVPLDDLDQAITYLKNVIVSCDGDVTYNKTTGQLAWSDTLRIIYNRTDGQAILNTVAAGNVTLTDGQFAYVDLSETNGAARTIYAATVTTGAASNFIAYNRLLLGYRNAASDDFFPAALISCLSGSGGSGGETVIADLTTTGDYSGDAYTDATVDTNSVGIGCALVLSSDGHYDEADASAASSPALPCSALAIETGTGTKKVLRRGLLCNTGWAWTPGLPIYVSETAGNLTQTAPTASSAGGEYVQHVGIALSATIIDFQPNLVYAKLAAA